MSRVVSSGGYGISKIIERLMDGAQVRRNHIKRLLNLTDKGEIEHLFEAARCMRNRYFHNNVFLYGFLYYSTYCRNDCCFCQYRNSNTTLDRYRKHHTEILAAAQEMRRSGVHLIDLTMGEDPMFCSGAEASRRIWEIVVQVKASTNLPIMISPGVVSNNILKSLAKAGVDWYACYQETHNIRHFNQLRCGQGYARRMAAKRLAKKHGMLLEDGILLGAGERLDDIVNSLYVMKRKGIDQVRAMRFVPVKGVTMDRVGKYNPLREYLTIAVMRLMMPDRLIPASLDVDGLQGLAARLDAGANVVTSVVPPDKGLAGVVNKSLDIEDARRSIKHIVPVLNSCGLVVATHQAYEKWLCLRRHAPIRRGIVQDIEKCA